MNSEAISRKTSVNFLLNGAAVEIDFSSNRDLYPHMTILQYLRESSRLTGTKEGCGVGDCGACTVCIIEKDASDNIIISSVNSCLIMLGMLDGKHLVTIEGVSRGAVMHPVQRSLVEKRGSQCGFCSPGMVMSAYAHYLNHRPFTREEIERSLSGNLCRCTGYESIMQALMDMDKYDREEEFFEFPKSCERELYVEQEGSVYIKPLNLSSLLRYKEMFQGYTLVSGASDLSVKFRAENAKNVKLIDISDIAELKRISIGNEYIEVGANISIEAANETLSRFYPQTYEYLSAFASLQIRNKATLAGSVAGASPVGDIMPLLLALDAKIRLVSLNYYRIVNARDFNLSYRKHVIRENEVIESFLIPLPVENYRLFCHKQSKRKDVDIATLTFCIYFVLENGLMKNVSTGYGGMAPIPRPSVKLENFLEGRPFTKRTFSGETLTKAKEILRGDFVPISDVRGSASYRHAVAGNLLTKLYNDLK